MQTWYFGSWETQKIGQVRKIGKIYSIMCKKMKM